MAKAHDEGKVITVYCHGGCGRSITLPNTSVHDGDYFGCDRNISGLECKSKFLPLTPGMVRMVTEFKSRGFFRIRDSWPCAELVVSYFGSPKKYAGKVAAIVIKKAIIKSRGRAIGEGIQDHLVHYFELPSWMK